MKTYEMDLEKLAKERNERINKAFTKNRLIKLDKVNDILIRTLKATLKDEEDNLWWWKNTMHGYDGDVAMIGHHKRNIRRIKRAIKIATE